MKNNEKTLAFFEAIDPKVKEAALANIAKHYGITQTEALAEVSDPDAEHFLDYVTGPERAGLSFLMRQHGSGVDDVRNYDVPFVFEPYLVKSSLKSAEVIAAQKGAFAVVDPTLDAKHSGVIIGITDHHVVVSLGRSALIVEKRHLDQIPKAGQDVNLTFSGGRGVLDVVQAKAVDR